MQNPSPPNARKVPFFEFSLLLVFTLVLVVFAGCKSGYDPHELDRPAGGTNSVILPPLAIGDTVTIDFAGLPDQDTLPPQMEKPIAEDGTITLPYIDRVQAAGKSPSLLESSIRDAYVPKFFTHLSVTVKATSDAVYFVRGEVKNPNRMVYVGPITVTKAITSAGDFTDFANRKNVYLIRSNGQRFKLNCDAILDGEAPDPPVFPGDQIEVKRKLF